MRVLSLPKRDRLLSCKNSIEVSQVRRDWNTLTGCLEFNHFSPFPDAISAQAFHASSFQILKLIKAFKNQS